MRSGDEMAWGEFVDRFQPLLEHFARRIGIPEWEWGACVTEVLDDEALRLTARTRALPATLGAYLVRAARNRYLRVKRAASRRHQHYTSASDPQRAEPVILSLCSENALRSSAGPALGDAVTTSGALARLAAILRAELSEDDLLLLTWRSAGVPHRQIAAWLGITYDAAAKRVARLSQQLRAIAQLRAQSFPPAERAELARFFRRVGAARSTGATPRGAQP
jgi:DNA-directed RNA polymerase specialized sigma24 family protein